MKDWFTIEKIDSASWAISEYGHWEETHCYLFVGSNTALLVDTGMGVENIATEVRRLTSLPVQVVLTHAHWDHIGGAANFGNITIHKSDSQWLEYGLPISDKSIQHTFAKEPTTKQLPADFDLKHYSTPKIRPNKTLTGGEVFDLGNRKLRIIHTPGHSPGSICVYEESTGYICTGDMLYEGTLYANYESTNPEEFASSIETITRLPNIAKILPGHHRLRVKVSLLREANEAFNRLENEGLLKQGTGLHNFGRLSISL